MAPYDGLDRSRAKLPHPSHFYTKTLLMNDTNFSVPLSDVKTLLKCILIRKAINY